MPSPKQAFFGVAAPTPAAPPPVSDLTVAELMDRLEQLGRNMQFVSQHTGASVPFTAHSLIWTLGDADPPPSILHEAIRREENIIAEILEKHASETRPCRACGVKLWFVRSQAGKLMPLCYDGTSHFSNCKAASQFRRAK